ncbi:MAG: TonB-dependent receptor Outer membrane receptor for ferrienterochelin and colicins [uncultured Campylobacterales bacterium]|uniref:TonB-dependent receptor Outer membrane receptor for ferrienterochelin and colicins n=1 Tax=uncultured Campylobacterales bacterium TaxID=352960 RepID=A0A6S6SAF8_9BACT|nr:MAG: TonB-dependent receptor Outer membrane receptor for ferrienterochelin and colicins [uncultured Campylobacterales bacterium]
MKILNGFHKKNYFALCTILAFAVASSLHAASSSTKENNLKLVDEKEYIPTFTIVKRIKVESAFKEDINASSITSELSIISKKQINNQNHLSTSDILTNNSTISVSSNGLAGQSKNLYLRGLDSSKILFLVDGVKYSDPTSISNSADISNLYLGNIDKIEIIKGAQPIIWGNASGGVINIITDSNNTTNSIDIMQGSFNTRKLNSNLNYSNYLVDVSLSSSHLKSDSLSAQSPKNTDPKDYEDDEYTNHTNTASINFKLDAYTKINLLHNNIYSYGNYDRSNPNGDDPFVSKNHIYRASFTHKKDKFSFNSYVSKNKFQRYYPTGFTKAFDGSISEIGVDGSYKYIPSSLIKFGITSEKSKDKEYNVSQLNNAIFLHNITDIKGTTISTGIRYDEFNTFKDKVTYQVGLKKDIKDFTIGSNYSSAYKTPSLYQLYETEFGIGNPNLKPEDVKSFDIYAGYKDIQISYFRTRIKNLIGFKNNRYQNLDSTSHINGLELTYFTKYKDILDFNMNFTHLLKLEGEDLLYRRAKNVLNSTLNFYMNKFTLGISSKYIGTRDDVIFDSNFNSVPVQTGRYTLFNLNLNYQINKSLKTYIKIDNITDKYYQNVAGFSSSPRAFYLGLKATF